MVSPSLSFFPFSITSLGYILRGSTTSQKMYIFHNPHCLLPCGSPKTRNQPPTGSVSSCVQVRGFPRITMSTDFYHFSLTFGKAALLHVFFVLLALELIFSNHPPVDPVSSPHDLSPKEASSTLCIWQMTALPTHTPAANRLARRWACCLPAKPLVRLDLQTQNFLTKVSSLLLCAELGCFPNLPSGCGQQLGRPGGEVLTTAHGPRPRNI